MTNRRLPLFVALGAFVVFVLTLSWGISAGGTTLAAVLAGWDWHPLFGTPARWLLTLPLRILPAGWVPVCLNLFAAACASVTLALLVRCVLLLSPGQSRRQSSEPAIGLPAFLACAACGLEYSFWHEATASSGEMLDVLLLAGMVWCFLEFLASRVIFWAGAAAFIWGAKVGQNWAMILTLPLCFATIVWQLKVEVINKKLWIAIIGMTLGGFCIWLIQPLWSGLLPGSPVTFSESFKSAFAASKNQFEIYHLVFWRAHRTLTLAVMAVYLVPILSCMLSKPDQIKSASKDADKFQVRVFYAAQVSLLVVCVWLALEPAFGPRQLIVRHLGSYIPLLNLDFLDGLGIGVLSASLLQKFGQSSRRRSRREDELSSLLQTVVQAVFLSLLIALGVGMALKNVYPVLLANIHPMSGYSRMALESLPQGTGGVIISDDPQKLHVVQAGLANIKDRSLWATVDTTSLASEKYRARLEKKFPWGWVDAQSNHELKPLEMLRLLQRISAGHRIFYLHHSFGYFFEQFYLEPRGAVYELKPLRPPVSVLPELSAALIAENENFWSLAWTNTLSSLSTRPSQGASEMAEFGRKILQSLGLAETPVQQDFLLRQWNSVRLDGWAVQLQQNGRLQEARTRFEQARDLNTNNASVLVNLGCNTDLIKGRPMNLGGITGISNWVGGDLERFGLTMKNNGPFDNPVCCFLLGNLFQKTMLPVQAIQNFVRASILAPGVLAPRYSLAEMYAQSPTPEKALELAASIRSSLTNLPDTEEVDAGLYFIEATAWAAKTNLPNARLALRNVVEKYSENSYTMNRVVQAYLAFGDLTNALPIAAQQLEKTPENPTAIMNKATVLAGLGNASNAIPLLDHLLSITNMPQARLSRAGAYLQITNLAAAEQDYNYFINAEPDSWAGNYGLAIIAMQRHDTNKAVARLRVCLANSRQGSYQYVVADRFMRTLSPADAEPAKSP